MKEEVRVLAATGMLGTGFSEESFNRALDLDPHVIGCDAGSTDPGPYYLGEGISMSSKGAVKRDLRIMIHGGLNKSIPVLIGSSGTAGGNPHLEWTKNIVKEIANEDGLHFKLATIQSEISPTTLIKYMESGKIKALSPAPSLNKAEINKIERIVGVMGAKPYIEAISEGAQVVIAGRSSDTSIFAAVPIMNGLNNGATWHAAKVLECGAGCVEQRIYPDSMMAWIRKDNFRVEPPNLKMKCTPTSVVSHSLYENEDLYKIVEPTGTIDTSEAEYYQDGDRGVKVVRSKYQHSTGYSIRIEGVRMVGYRQIAVGEIRDPIVLKQLDFFLQGAKEQIQKKVNISLGLSLEEYKLNFRKLGEANINNNIDNNNLSGVGVIIEVLAEKEENSNSIMSIAWHTALHHPVKEWSGLVSQIAFPYSPPNINTGKVYEFCLNHVIEVEDPSELFTIKIEEI